MSVTTEPDDHDTPRLRVLQLTSSARRRGAEVFAHQLSEQLERRGVQVTTLALEPTDDPTDLPFLQPRHGRFDPRTIGRIVRLARAHDVVVTHAGSTLLTTAIAATLARRPYVYRNISDPAHWGRVRAADLRIGMPLRHSAHVVALYGAAGRFLTSQYRLRADRVTVISNAVDATRFERRDDATRRAARAAYGLNDDPVVGFLGALVDEKRPEVAVEIVAALPSVTLLLGGAGPLHDDVAAKVAELGVQDRVHLLGPLSDPAPLLSAVDLLLAPSTTEGVPGVILEAAMIGVPIVATDVGGVGELIRDMGAGVAAPVDDVEALTDGVFAVLSDPEGYVAPRSALEPRFDIGSVAIAWLEVLESVTPRRRSGRSRRAARSTPAA